MYAGINYIFRYYTAFDKLRLTAFCHVEQCHTELVEVLSKHRQEADLYDKKQF